MIQTWRRTFIPRGGVRYHQHHRSVLALRQRGSQFPIAGIFIIFTGIFVGLDSLLPAAGAVASINVIATSGTIVGSALSNIAEAKSGLDPRYTNSKDFSAGLGNALEKDREAADDLFD